MNSILNNFKTRFEKRFKEQSILNLGEDSVRYDFFTALMYGLKVDSHRIQVEFPINQLAFVSTPNPNSKRNENPQIDLFLAQENINLSAEFGLFKRNSNLEGSINTTEKVFKMLNDMLRLSLNSFYQPNEAYFICVADSKILGAQMRDIALPQFPAEFYSFDYQDLNDWIRLLKSADSAFDKRFVSKANMLEHRIEAELIYNEQIENPTFEVIPENILETRVIAYRIESNNKHKAY
jgi:hypothetical protein